MAGSRRSPLISSQNPLFEFALKCVLAGLDMDLIAKRMVGLRKSHGGPTIFNLSEIRAFSPVPDSPIR